MSVRGSIWQMVSVAVTLLPCGWVSPAHAITLDWVTVGDPGNWADTTGYGAVSTSFQIMKFEFTNAQYTEFLNAIDPEGTNPNSVYSTFMGIFPRGGISFNSGESLGNKYSVMADMGNKPVGVNWFGAARVSNWLHNGAQTYVTSDSTASAPQNTGAYEVGTITVGYAPAKNESARYWVPTENEWYKAAYFDPNHGGAGVPGYWNYATATDTAPTSVTAIDEIGPNRGDGSAGGVGNFANLESRADWNNLDGNVTTVGTNGGASAYGTFDQIGNVWEWNDLDGIAGPFRGLRGGYWLNSASEVPSSNRNTAEPKRYFEYFGFRLASPAVAVPEPSTWAMGLVGLTCAAWGAARRRRTSKLRSRGVVSGAVAAAVVSVFVMGSASSAHAVTIDFVTVGDAGNANDTTGYGQVMSAFQIGKYEVTIGQYTEFLNAVAATDTYGLYNPEMESEPEVAGITRSGSPGSYTYSVTGPNGSTPAGADSAGNRPIAFVSWFDAARFANWMHNGQGSSSTETGAYDLVSAPHGVAPAKSPGAQFYIPTESEWYKAAYFSPNYGGVGVPGYFDYATQSDSAPGNVIGSVANQANYRPLPGRILSVTQSEYSSVQNYLTNVGAFTNSGSYYETFDQSGNVWEWNDLDGVASSYVALQGGSWDDSNESSLSSSSLSTFAPSWEDIYSGFRLASPVLTVPEPSTWVMGLAGLVCGGWHVFRRRKRA